MTQKVAKLNFVLACKTYKGDIKSFERLYRSFTEHNADGIPLIVSVPEEDKELFSKILKSKTDTQLISDESYAQKYFVSESIMGLSVGYINQEICKLAFWESDMAANVLFVDSDAYFIRDFRTSDFMASSTVPYSVLTMDKDLQIESFYRAYGHERRAHIKRIFSAVGLEDSRLLTCHGMTVLNAKVLRDLKKNFMEPNNYKYADLLRISPFEYSWYNAWLQKSNIIPIFHSEPFFKTFHMRIEYVFTRLKLISERDLAEQYVGIILNSNWYPKKPPSKYQDPGKFHRLIYTLVRRLG